LTDIDAVGVPGKDPVVGVTINQVALGVPAVHVGFPEGALIVTD
jgi:hypothetical protein